MFARIESLPWRRLAARAVMATVAVAGLCALADQGARRLKSSMPGRVATREARPATDPVTTGSIRPAAATGQTAAPTGEGLDRRGLAMLVSNGAAPAQAPAATAPKRKPEPAAQRAR